MSDVDKTFFSFIFFSIHFCVILLFDDEFITTHLQVGGQWAPAADAARFPDVVSTVLSGSISGGAGEKAACMLVVISWRVVMGIISGAFLCVSSNHRLCAHTSLFASYTIICVSIKYFYYSCRVWFCPICAKCQTKKINK